MNRVTHTPMAVTKFEALLLKPNRRVTICDTPYDTRVWITKMTGITARSASLSAFSWAASLVKTAKKEKEKMVSPEALMRAA